MRISNNDSKNFALLPIFAYDDDYVPLSPIGTPVPEEILIPEKQLSDRTNERNGKELGVISETSETPTSNISSELTSSLKETAQVPNESDGKPIQNGRLSPEVQVLDITDLNDPGVRIISKFSLKDVDNKFQIKIYGRGISS